MTTTTDNDLKELKDLIVSKFEQVDRKLERISEDITEMKIDIATLKEGQNSLNMRLNETKESLNNRINETKEAINKRLDNLDFIARSVVTGILVALLAGLTKMLYPNLFG